MVYFLSWAALPAEFTGIFTADPLRAVKNWHMFFCVASGLWGGLVIGIATEYYTSNRYEPVRVRPTKTLASVERSWVSQDPKALKSKNHTRHENFH